MRALFLLAIVLIAGCTGAPAAKKGDSVTVDYVGSLQDGTVFDTSYEKVAREKGIYNEGRKYEPLTFTIGGGQMISGFDRAVAGMREGEEKEATIPPEQAYGQPDPSLIGAVSRSIFEQNGITPIAGAVISTKAGNARIISFNETAVTLDFNHELAGKTLVFRIKLERINAGK